MAIEFIRKHLRAMLHPAKWPHQPHDHVLRESEMMQQAFAKVLHYIFQNPVRAGLVAQWKDYPHIGCCVAGYPDLNVRREAYLDLFWRIHHRLAQPN